ncbi:MAG: serine/threonine protein kinase, partial [Planctomycetota bacterium]
MDSPRPRASRRGSPPPSAGSSTPVTTPSGDEELTRVAEPRRGTSPRTTPHIDDPRALFAVLQKSQLLDDDQLARVRPAVGRARSARELAVALVREGLITRWQAEQLLLGRTRFFLGKYKLLDVLGQGGMGAVLKAEQLGLGRQVALKVMAKGLLHSQAAINRFLREIRSVAALDHPHIIKAIDADRVGDQYFLVMEYQEGMVLKDWIKKYGRLPIDWSCECIRQAALALQHAHERNLVHRDIKPSNLLVWSDPETHRPHVKILDMGLARFVSESAQEGEITQTGQIMGSPDYIAPEQARSAKDADIRADIFSLGCTLFHMIAGEVPFSGDTIMEKLVKRIEQEAPPLSTKRPEVPPELDRIVARMLRRNPDERYQTPAEVAAALESFLRGEPQTPFAQPSEPVGSDSRDDWRPEPLPHELDESLSGLIPQTDFAEAAPIADTSATVLLDARNKPAPDGEGPTVVSDSPIARPSSPFSPPSVLPGVPRYGARHATRRRDSSASVWIVVGAIGLCILLIILALLSGSSDSPSPAARPSHPTSAGRTDSASHTPAAPGSNRPRQSVPAGPEPPARNPRSEHLRRLAAGILEVGGTVTIATPRGPSEKLVAIRPGRRLPPGDFDIIEID